nr:leucine-rich repeat protein [uncultured Roseburia sp.]
MKKKGMIAAVAMIAAFIAVMPTAVTANAVSAAEIQEETEELRKDSADGVYNHLKYTINNNNTITITGMDNANDDTDVELVIPAEIDGRKVTKIGWMAFYGCVNIKSVVLNDGLVEIDGSAFNGTSISEMDVPATVTTIGQRAFGNCINLARVTFHEGLRKIDNYAFQDCKMLTGKITIPSTTTGIGENAFSGTAITGLAIEEGTTDIRLESQAFANCTNLNELELNRVVSIGASCFENDTAITEVTLSQGLREIGYGAFLENNSLGGDLVIPSTVTSIGERAFSRTSIKSLTIEDGNNGITIGAYAFENCANLKYANLSNRLKMIDYDAFRYDPMLVWVKIADGNYSLTIRSFAFYENKNLKVISLPTKVAKIEINVFNNCLKLEDVYYASSQENYNTYVTVDEYNNDPYYNATLHYNSQGPDEWPDATYTGWITIIGKDYWYENDVLQGYDPTNADYRGKEIYDPDSDAWYWLDNVQKGAKAVSKDVYQESEAGQWAENADGTGKWVRYDADGHMVKGWQTTDQGTYYFDPVYGTMAKGTAMIDGTTYYFDTNTGILQSTSPVENGWWSDGGQTYWYENGVRQGYDPNNADYRGKEIYDPDSDAWYWLDNVQQGAKAVSKDVYQESEAGQWADREDGTGKWVRYDADGHMVKGWQTTDQGTYYFDPVYGTMAKGNAVIDGATYYFDVTTGILQ